MKKTAIRGVAAAALLLAAPVVSATYAVADVVPSIDAGFSVAKPSQQSQSVLPSGQLAVDRFVAELEQETGKKYVKIKYTGSDSANIQILPAGMKPEGKEKVKEIEEVLKLNGYTDLQWWAVL